MPSLVAKKPPSIHSMNAYASAGRSIEQINYVHALAFVWQAWHGIVHI
jgi:hypothetical protein